MPAAEAGATGGGDWAICCSGDGIRSAAYCLGALPSLDSGGLLETAKSIVGVSGGSYIASSRALVAHDLPPGTVPHAYTPGTAEERNFRDNTRYIAPNGATVLVGALSLQLYDAAEFEAYHELGEAAVLAAAKECTPPLTCPVPVGHGSPPTPAQLRNAPGR